MNQLETRQVTPQEQIDALQVMEHVPAVAATANDKGIVIGVTGHRVLAELDKIVTGVDEALEQIQERFPDCLFTVLSSLAEGADRIVAQRVLARPNARMVVILPLPRADYRADFQTDESMREFLELLGRAAEVIELPPAAGRAAAYETAGLYVLNHCDVLITLWDGRAEQGIGGTGAIVARARERRLPIAWIHVGNRKPGTEEPTTLGAEQGAVTFENF